MSTFKATLLRLARERRGLFATELARRCGVTPQTVSNWESGTTTPAKRSVDQVAQTLGFPASFFFGVDIDPLSEGAATFRARSKIAARDKHVAQAAGTMAVELLKWIEERFELPDVDLPDFAGQDPDLVARLVRGEWMLGQRPIPNMIHLLESRGVAVLSLAQDCRAIDAFSFWLGERPIVLLNTMKTAERSRIDAAHELCHLLCHREETSKQEEKDADRFAGALLMPADDVYQHVGRSANLQNLISLKHRWGVSLAALVYRLHELGLITDWQYRILFIEISKRGYRTNEPRPIDRERSSVLAQVFETLRERGSGVKDVARDLRWRREDVEEFIFGLGATLTSLRGGGKGTSSVDAPRLRLVDSDAAESEDGVS